MSQVAVVWVDVRPCEVCGKKATKIATMISEDGTAVSKCSCDAHQKKVQEEVNATMAAFGYSE